MTPTASATPPTNAYAPAAPPPEKPEDTSNPANFEEPQTLTFDELGRLTQTVTVKDVTTNTTRYIYDAHGNLLLQKDPATTTLYLPGQQITLTTATGTTTGTRYYPLPGGGTAIRTGSGTNYGFTIADHHGTATVRLDNTAQTPTWRQFTPYGAPRGTTSTWIDNRGFLNQPVNPTTGLNQIGARNYDPDTGRFISTDLITNLFDPQQLNGYNYANNNPTTYSDPTGLLTTSEAVHISANAVPYVRAPTGGGGGLGIIQSGPTYVRAPAPTDPIPAGNGQVTGGSSVSGINGAGSGYGGYGAGASRSSGPDVDKHSSRGGSASGSTTAVYNVGGNRFDRYYDHKFERPARTDPVQPPRKDPLPQIKPEPEPQPQPASGGAGGSRGGGGNDNCGGGGGDNDSTPWDIVEEVAQGVADQGMDAIDARLTEAQWDAIAEEGWLIWRYRGSEVHKMTAAELERQFPGQFYIEQQAQTFCTS